MPKRDDTTTALASQEDFRAALWLEAQVAVRVFIEHAMREELRHLVQAEPYQRSQRRGGYRNGYYEREMFVAGVSRYA